MNASQDFFVGGLPAGARSGKGGDDPVQGAQFLLGALRALKQTS